MIVPKTVSAKDIQRDYRRVFTEAKLSKKPIVVLTNNKPDVVIMGVVEAEGLYAKARQAEMIEALEAVQVYTSEKKLGKLKKMKSLSNLM